MAEGYRLRWAKEKSSRPRDFWEIRNSEDYKRWRTAVFENDNWTCQDCGARGVYLNAHHLFPWRDFPEVRYEVWNGETLCVECHKARHYARAAA